MSIFLKSSRAIKHSDISGTSKLLFIHLKLYGITAQSTALFIHALMYTIHTHALKRSHTHIHITHRGEIAGIAVGGIVLLAIVGGVILMVGYLYYKSRFANPKVIDSVSCYSYILI